MATWGKVSETMGGNCAMGGCCNRGDSVSGVMSMALNAAKGISGSSVDLSMGAPPQNTNGNGGRSV